MIIAMLVVVIVMAKIQEIDKAINMTIEMERVYSLDDV